MSATMEGWTGRGEVRINLGAGAYGSVFENGCDRNLLGMLILCGRYPRGSRGTCAMEGIDVVTSGRIGPPGLVRRIFGRDHPAGGNCGLAECAGRAQFLGVAVGEPAHAARRRDWGLGGWTCPHRPLSPLRGFLPEAMTRAPRRLFHEKRRAH